MWQYKDNGSSLGCLAQLGLGYIVTMCCSLPLQVSSPRVSARPVLCRSERIRAAPGQSNQELRVIFSMKKRRDSVTELAQIGRTLLAILSFLQHGCTSLLGCKLTVRDEHLGSGLT